MNFNNEFMLFETADPQLVFKSTRGYWDNSDDLRDRLYTLDDCGFYTAVFQRAYILYNAWCRKDISSTKYRYASLKDKRIRSRFLTDFNFIYYSKKLNRFFVSMLHSVTVDPCICLDESTKNEVFDHLSQLHDFPSILKDAAKLFETTRFCDYDYFADNFWEVLYRYGYEL